MNMQCSQEPPPQKKKHNYSVLNDYWFTKFTFSCNYKPFPTQNNLIKTCIIKQKIQVLQSI